MSVLPSLASLGQDQTPVSVFVERFANLKTTQQNDTIVRQPESAFLTTIEEEKGRVLVGFAIIFKGREGQDDAIQYYLGINDPIVNDVNELLKRTFDTGADGKLENQVYGYRLRSRLFKNQKQFQITMEYGSFSTYFRATTDPRVVHRATLQLEGGMGNIGLGSSVFEIPEGFRRA